MRRPEKEDRDKKAGIRSTEQKSRSKKEETGK